MPVELGLRLEGIDRLERNLSRLPELAQRQLRDVATTLRNLVVGRTPYDSGELKDSWTDVSATSTGFTFGTDKDYAVVLEEGLYKNVGPRTVAVSGGIFSRQAPGGIVGPIVEDDEALDQLVDSIAEGLAVELEKL